MDMSNASGSGPPYGAPVEDMLFCMEHVANWRTGVHVPAELQADDLRTLLLQAGRLVSERVAPLNAGGDRAPPALHNGEVRMPDAWKAAFREWAAAGWLGLPLPVSHGGAGMPAILGAATMEMLSSACMSFSTLSVLNQGAVEALAAHASDALKSHYLPRLISGEWTASMALTEPHAGSDLGALRTTATPAPDGTYRIRGRKVYITFGEHDMSGNICHLVLARMPGAPPGSRGISLLLAPKWLPDGTRNDITCIGIEHKLGLRASPTCAMVFGEGDGATGWLVGEPHQGLRCMFTMMNRARLATGIQGVAIGERALQQAIAYARERRQGRLPGAYKSTPIIAHPDVARNLLLMSALTAASRALAYRAAAEIHRAAQGCDEAMRARAQGQADMLTPLVKAFATDNGVTVASLGIQIHGGAGYIEDTGAAQHWRDARIAPIFEGTNGIQAIDLVTRKMQRDEGTVVRELLAEAAATGAQLTLTGGSQLAHAARQLAAAVTSAQLATDWILASARDSDHRLAVATPYAELLATTLAGALLGKGALAAVAGSGQGAEVPVPNQRQIVVARFYLQSVLPHAGALAQSVMAGGADALHMRALWQNG